MIVLAQTLLYLLALAGIAAGAMGTLFFAAGAMNRAAPAQVRRRRWLLAALSLCGIVASAAGGFVGIAAIMYFASR